jgi:hypothetical protein
MASSMWYFSERLHDYVTVATTKKRRHRIEKYIYIFLTSNIGHIEVFQVSKIHINFCLLKILYGHTTCDRTKIPVFNNIMCTTAYSLLYSCIQPQHGFSQNT